MSEEEKATTVLQLLEELGPILETPIQQLRAGDLRKAKARFDALRDILRGRPDVMNMGPPHAPPVAGPPGPRPAAPGSSAPTWSPGRQPPTVVPIDDDEDDE